MTFLRTYTMKWWDIGLLKLYVFVIGAALGAYFSEFFMSIMGVLLAIFVVLLVYFLYALASNKF